MGSKKIKLIHKKNKNLIDKSFIVNSTIKYKKEKKIYKSKLDIDSLSSSGSIDSSSSSCNNCSIGSISITSPKLTTSGISSIDSNSTCINIIETINSESGIGFETSTIGPTDTSIPSISFPSTSEKESKDSSSSSSSKSKDSSSSSSSKSKDSYSDSNSNSNSNSDVKKICKKEIVKYIIVPNGGRGGLCGYAFVANKKKQLVNPKCFVNFSITNFPVLGVKKPKGCDSIFVLDKAGIYKFQFFIKGAINESSSSSSLPETIIFDLLANGKKIKGSQFASSGQLTGVVIGEFPCNTKISLRNISDSCVCLYSDNSEKDINASLLIEKLN